MYDATPPCVPIPHQGRHLHPGRQRKNQEDLPCYPFLRNIDEQLCAAADEWVEKKWAITSSRATSEAEDLVEEEEDVIILSPRRVSFKKRCLSHLSRLGQDTKDAKDEGVVLLMHSHHFSGVYLAVLAFHALTASCATKILARLQYSFIAINVALVLVMLVGLPAATLGDLKNSARYAFGNFENSLAVLTNSLAERLHFHFEFLSTVGRFDVGVHISEEAQNANVAVPWAIISIVILSNPVQQPMATILLKSFGKKGMLVIWSFIFIALFMSGVSLFGLAHFLLLPTFAFSQDGALPFSRLLYNINPSTGTPVRCVWLSATCAALLGLITFAGPAATGTLFTLSVVGQYIANSIPITGRYIGGQAFKRVPIITGLRWKSHRRYDYQSLPVAVVAVLWMWFMTVILMFPLVPGPGQQMMNYTAIVMGSVLFLALAYYYMPRYGGVYWFNGPVSNIDGRKLEEKQEDTSGSSAHGGLCASPADFASSMAG
ncbi:amino acid permease-domain-containing protein [Mycena sp. CBHHK59/15]|nr:amino acid permease-domain-containing protein [Mycena sp. CBHHK59/15]